MLGERRHLVAPVVPESWDAVDENDERPRPLGDVVNLDAAGIGEAVLAQVRSIGCEGHDKTPIRRSRF